MKNFWKYLFFNRKKQEILKVNQPKLALNTIDDDERRYIVENGSVPKAYTKNEDGAEFLPINKT